MTDNTEYVSTLDNAVGELTRQRRSQANAKAKTAPFDFRGVLTGRTIERPVPYADSRKPCPVCGAAPIDTLPYESWDRLSHDCHCVMESPDAYYRGLRDIWKRRNALPHFLKDLPDIYRDCTRENLRVTEGNTAAMTAIKGLGKKRLTQNLYLYGPAGTGKSHIGTAIARVMAEEGKTARFWGMASLVKLLREVSRPGSTQAAPELRHWDVLLLDDIDKIKPSDFAYAEIYELIEYRWAHKKVTIFTAQHDPIQTAKLLTPADLERNADPLSSRMGSGLVFKVTGTDERASRSRVATI